MIAWPLATPVTEPSEATVAVPGDRDTYVTAAVSMTEPSAALTMAANADVAPTSTMPEYPANLIEPGGISAVAVTVTGVRPDTDARNVCVPPDGPSVIAVCARPCASVWAVAGLTLPFPETAVNETVVPVIA